MVPNDLIKMLKNSASWVINQRLIKKFSSSLRPGSLGSNSILNSLSIGEQTTNHNKYQSNNYCDYKDRSNDVDNRLNETNLDYQSAPNHLNRLRYKTKANQQFRKKEQEILSNLGLDNYAKIYEDNLRSFQDNDSDNQILTPEESVKYFEKFLENRHFKDHSINEFSSLRDFETKKDQIKEILKNYELEKYYTSQVPTKLTIENMIALLEMTNESDRIKHLNYLFKKEAKAYSRRKKKEISKVETEERLSEKYSETDHRTGLEYDHNGRLIYAKWRNTMFIALNKEFLRKEPNRRIMDATRFGPRLVIDFGYDDDVMKPQTFSTLTTQMYHLIAETFDAKIPAHLNLCNLSKSSALCKHFEKSLPYIFQKNCLLNATDKSYLDIFPRSKLIYLSPDAHQKLKTVDPEKVYILGGMCDKYCRGDYAYQKAQSENLPCYKLPLDDYFFFKQDRVLTINLVVAILQKFYYYKNWRQSLIGSIPVRKLKAPEELRIEQIRKVKKFYNKEKFFKIYKMDEIDADDEMNDNQKSSKDEYRLSQSNKPIFNPKYREYRTYQSKYSPTRSNDNYEPRHSQNYYRSRNKDDYY